MIPVLSYFLHLKHTHTGGGGWEKVSMASREIKIHVFQSRKQCEKKIIQCGIIKFTSTASVASHCSWDQVQISLHSLAPQASLLSALLAASALKGWAFLALLHNLLHIQTWIHPCLLRTVYTSRRMCPYCQTPEKGLLPCLMVATCHPSPP